MSKLEQLIKELCPEGVESIVLEKLGKVSMCKRILKSETNSNDGIPFYKIGTFGKKADAFISFEQFKEYKNKFSFPNKGDILISASGTIGRTVIYNGEPAYFQDSNIVWLAHNESKLLNKFLFYYYQLEPWNISTGGTISRLYNDNINKIKIPLPPLAVQEEIVKILDNFTELTAELTAELSARKKQYEYYREQLLSFGDDVEWGTLNKISENLDSKRKPVTKSLRKQGQYPYYGASGIVDYVEDYIFDGDFLLISEDGANLVARTTPIAFSITGKNWVNNHAHVLKFNTYEERRFVEIYLNSIDLSRYISTAAQPKLTKENLNKIPIPIPPLDEQERIVAILDRFDTLVNNIKEGLPAEIEARKKQYEYYRDKLLSFPCIN